MKTSWGPPTPWRSIFKWIGIYLGVQIVAGVIVPSRWQGLVSLALLAAMIIAHLIGRRWRRSGEWSEWKAAKTTKE